MKKVLFMLAFIATLLVGSMGTAGAQVNYTVYDGTTTNSYVPVYGLYTDSYLKCEYVIPATDLTAINGSNISALTYHLYSAPAAAWTCNFQVFVKEVTSSSISSFSGIDDATIVYEGTLDATSGTMVVNFTTPYQYNGGNLLIGFYNTNTGNYKSAYFYGQTISNSSVQGYNGSNPASITANQRNFIPKTTFTVDELHGCITPTQLAVSDVATYGATVTWTPGNTETAWVVKFNDLEFPTTTPSYTATTLDPNTTYVASVKAVCSATEESEYTTPGVSFTTLPTCPAPSAVTFSNITTTSVDVAWTNGGSETAWTIDANGTEYTANSNPFTLTGLTPATSYTVKVKANCSATDESDWSTTATFETPCVAVVVTETEPFTEDFNTLTTGIPSCWDNAEGTVATASYRWNYYATGVTGACVRFNSYNPSSGQYSLLKTPVLDLTAMGNPMLTFTHKNPSAAQGFDVMYTTDGGTTYTTIATGLQGATAWTTEEIIVPELANANNVMFVFKGISNCGSDYSGSYIFLDNVLVSQAPTCPKPTGVTVSNITSNSAVISWTNGGSETAWTIDANGTEYTANSNPFTLTGLTPATSYTVKVKANCSATDESDWSTTATFATPCVAVVVTETEPFTEDFNTLTAGIPSCWDNAEGTTTDNSYKWNYFATGVTGACVRFNSFSNSSNKTNYLKTPQLDLSGLTNPMVSFSYKNPTGGDFSVYYTIDGTNYEEIATGLTGVSSWTNVEYTIADLAGATNAYIIFKGTSNWGSGDAYIYLDDVMVSQVPTCPKPTDVTVNDITTTSAEISWTNGGTETAWTISYNGTEVAANSNPFTLTGLTPATVYTVKVKANCSAEDESYWSTTAEFATECVTVVVTANNPFTENFNTLTDGIPLCWDNAEGTTTTDSYKWNYFATGVTGACVRFNSYSNSNNNTNYLKTSELDLSGLTNPMVSFSYKNPAGGDFSVFYTVDGTNYVEIATGLTGVSAWTNVEYAIADLAGATNAYIIFKGTSNWGSGDAYIYLDDVLVSQVPTCLKPTEVVILDSLTTDNSAVVDWTPAGDETQWEVACNGDTTLVSTHPFTITGLSASTTYTVSVRAYCSDEDQSYWTSGVNFNTECAAVVVVTFDNPYHEGFEGTICWSTQQIAGEDNWQLTDYSVYEGEYSAYFPYDEGAEGLLISPVFDLTQIANPELSFQYWTRIYSGSCDRLELYYRTAETEEWVLMDTFVTPMSDYDSATYALPTPTATYQIAFKGIGLDAFGLYLDDINITGEEIETPCEVPTNLAVENNVATWESEADNFNVMYIANGDTTTVAVEGNTYTFTGLEDSTLVTVFVQAVCDETTTSDWTEGVEFMYIDTTTVGIANFSNIAVKVYPNPATDVINIECNAINANLAIFDMFGKQVMNTQIQNAKTELNISALAPGVYMIRIANNNEFTTVKVVKK